MLFLVFQNRNVLSGESFVHSQVYQVPAENIHFIDGNRNISIMGDEPFIANMQCNKGLKESNKKHLVTIIAQCTDCTSRMNDIVDRQKTPTGYKTSSRERMRLHRFRYQMMKETAASCPKCGPLI